MKRKKRLTKREIQAINGKGPTGQFRARSLVKMPPIEDIAACLNSSPEQVQETVDSLVASGFMTPAT